MQRAPLNVLPGWPREGGQAGGRAEENPRAG